MNETTIRNPCREPSADIALTTVADAWRDAVGRYADRRCIWTEDVVVTYGELDTWSSHVAHRLIEAGVVAGTPVVTAVENSARYMALILAVSRLGAVLVPIDPDQPDAEFADLVVRSRATHVVARWRGRPTWLDGMISATRVDADPLLERPDPTAKVPDLPDAVREPQDPWAIFYTSGSTSKPRGAVIPQCGFAICGRALADAAGFTGDDVVLTVLPMHHLSVPVMSFAPAMANGSAMAIATRFSRSGFFDLVRVSGSTVTVTVPTIVEMLLTREPQESDRDHPLRLVITHRRIPEFERRFGARIAALWGMTETAGMGCLQRPGDDRPDTIGRPYPQTAEVRLVGVDGADVTPGETGELWFRHPGVMLGYHDEKPPPEGWIVSGDLCSALGDGSYRYMGRSKNMIKRGGENISLEELERVLFEHPAVDEIVVVAVPDPIYIEEACAVVVWHGGDPRIGDLRAFCRERLVSWKEPRYILTWPERLPELVNHKIDRRAVRRGVVLDEADDKQARSQ